MPFAGRRPPAADAVAADRHVGRFVQLSIRSCCHDRGDETPCRWARETTGESTLMPENWTYTTTRVLYCILREHNYIVALKLIKTHSSPTGSDFLQLLTLTYTAEARFNVVRRPCTT